MLSGALSQATPAPTACAPVALPKAAIRVRMSFFIVRLPLSMRGEGNALGHGLEFAQPAPPRHQQEDPKLEQRTDLGNTLADRGRRLHAQVRQDDEVDD